MVTNPVSAMPKPAHPLDATRQAVASYARWAARDFDRTGHGNLVVVVRRFAWKAQADGSLRQEAVDQAVATGLFEALRQVDTQRHSDAIAALSADPLFSPWEGGMIGTALGSAAFSASGVLNTCVASQLTKDGEFLDNEAAVQARFDEVCRFLVNDTVEASLLIPLTSLQLDADAAGLSIWDGSHIGRLATAEFEACANAGVIIPMFAGTPQIALEHGGFGCRIKVPISVVRTAPGAAPQGAAQTSIGKRRFGELSYTALNEVVDDLLFTLRLSDASKVEAYGVMLVCETFAGTYSTYFRRGTPFYSTYPINAETVGRINAAWSALKGMQRNGRVPRIAVRRFNTAVEETLADDAIADLMIAAEALFLNDQEKEQRGELGYRLRLRAAKLLEKEGFDPRRVLKVFSVAYGLRSVVAHGGEIDEPIPLQGAQLSAREFLDVTVEMMRKALGVAAVKYQGQPPFGKTEFWDSLIFP